MDAHVVCIVKVVRGEAVAGLVGLAGFTGLLALTACGRAVHARPQHHALLHALQTADGPLLLGLLGLKRLLLLLLLSDRVQYHVALAERSWLLLQRRAVRSGDGRRPATS